MRPRITITISQEILDQVDKVINGKTIRNRSQAIETLLISATRPKVKSALILAGGPVTAHLPTKKRVPKAVIDVNGTPLIVHMLNHLNAHGVTNFFISVGPESEKPIKLALEKSPSSISNIQFIKEPKHLGTGGALKAAAKFLMGSDFLVIHGDVLSDFNLTELISFHKSQDRMATVAVKPRPGKATYGKIFLEGSNVTDFQAGSTAQISLVNTGIYLFAKKIFEFMPKSTVFSLEKNLIPKLIEKKQMAGYVFQGIWFDISEPQNYKQALGRWPGK